MKFKPLITKYLKYKIEFDLDLSNRFAYQILSKLKFMNFIDHSFFHLLFHF